jgi:putative flippase GtrA
MPPQSAAARATKRGDGRLLVMVSAPTTGRSLTRAWRTRLFYRWEQTPRFVRNALISLPTFLIDIGVLFILARLARVNYLVATIVSFLVANGLGYFLARWLVFAGTSRGLRVGLIYFLGIAGLSALALVPLMWLSVSVLHLDVVVSRIVTAGIVGIGGYLLNRVFNFRVEGAATSALPADHWPPRSVSPSGSDLEANQRSATCKVTS